MKATKSRCCRTCKLWGAPPFKSEREQITWAECPIVHPKFDMPVREWRVDEDLGRVRGRWAETGEVVKDGGGGRTYSSHADYVCDQFVRV